MLALYGCAGKQDAAGPGQDCYRDDDCEDGFVCAISGLDEVAAKERFARVNSALEHGSVAATVAELQAGETTEELMARAGATRR